MWFSISVIHIWHSLRLWRRPWARFWARTCPSHWPRPLAQSYDPSAKTIGLGQGLGQGLAYGLSQGVEPRLLAVSLGCGFGQVPGSWPGPCPKVWPRPGPGRWLQCYGHGLGHGLVRVHGVANRKCCVVLIQRDLTSWVLVKHKCAASKPLRNARCFHDILRNAIRGIIRMIVACLSSSSQSSGASRKC